MIRISSHPIFIALAILVGVMAYLELDIHAEIFNDNALRPTIIQGDHFPKVLVDPIGEAYTLNQPPQRIVSVTLGTDEILSALVNSNRITGVTHLSDNLDMSNIPHWYPEHVKRVQGEVEEILALEPDLVFVASYTRAEVVRLLLSSNIPVVRLSQYDSFGDIEDNIQLVAKVTGTEQQAASLLEGLRQKAQLITQKVNGRNRARVLYYSLNGYTAGAGTKINEMIEMAGGYNVIKETQITGSHKISEEIAIGLEPDIILISGGSPDNQAPPSELLSARASWQNTPAVLNNQVYDLQGTWLLSVSHYSWDGIEVLARILHPEVFK